VFGFLLSPIEFGQRKEEREKKKKSDYTLHPKMEVEPALNLPDLNIPD
jgi:hypothetical protein